MLSFMKVRSNLGPNCDEERDRIRMVIEKITPATTCTSSPVPM